MTRDTLTTGIVILTFIAVAVIFGLDMALAAASGGLAATVFCLHEVGRKKHLTGATNDR